MRARATAWIGAGLAAALGVAACEGGESADPSVGRTRVGVPHDGLSGLTADGEGLLFAVAERERVIVALDGAGGGRAIPIRGVPEGVDLESIAWVEGGRFLIGSEAEDEDRAEDAIFEVAIEGAEARVTATHRVRYAALGLRPSANDGLEGLCHANGWWIAAVERPVDGAATLAVRRPGEATFGARRVRLTTPIGKVSALSCAPDGDGVLVHAIERGIERSVFGDTWVARVIAFRLPEEGETASPRVVADLAGRVPDRPNPEGLVVRDGAATLVTDNHYRVRVGDAALLRVRIR